MYDDITGNDLLSDYNVVNQVCCLVSLITLNRAITMPGLGKQLRHGKRYRFKNLSLDHFVKTYKRANRRAMFLDHDGTVVLQSSIDSVMQLYTEAIDGSYIETKENALIWHYQDADIDFRSCQNIGRTSVGVYQYGLGCDGSNMRIETSGRDGNEICFSIVVLSEMSLLTVTPNANIALGCMLVQLDDSGKERAIYYWSKMMLDYETRPALIGRLMRWLIILTEFDIHYVTQKSIRGSIVANHLASLPVFDGRVIDDNFPDEDIVVVTSLSG
ncbi:hypothetical protein CK203_114563 [Vitis vinifera]|uniref:Uncharacterized protein n=1 Tax=Vitis vinifera TaxID=29760 RepID=A0A438CAD9_VITVI|nr:hypothetical protein CK203_114563 [Vitis vinifera]